MACRYEHFFRFAVAHLLLFGSAKDFGNTWLRKGTKDKKKGKNAVAAGHVAHSNEAGLPSASAPRAASTAGAGNSAGAAAAAEATSAGASGHSRGGADEPPAGLQGNKFKLPAYIRAEITKRAAQIRWTSQFKKAYSDFVRCAP